MMVGVACDNNWGIGQELANCKEFGKYCFYHVNGEEKRIITKVWLLKKSQILISGLLSSVIIYKNCFK